MQSAGFFGNLGGGIRDTLAGLIPGGRPRVRTPEEERADAAERALRVYKPTEDEQTLVRLVEERYQEAKAAKTAYHKRWAMNLAFFRGQQWMSWEPATQTLVETLIGEDEPSWREMVTDNQITMMVVTAVSKWGRAKPVTVGSPNNPNDPLDVAAAGAATKSLRHLARITERDRKRRRTDLLRAIYGSAFLKPYWDPMARTEVALVDPESGQPTGHEAWIGEEQFEVLTVWETFPAPASDWQRTGWCVVARRQTLEWIADTFGERGAAVPAEDAEGDLFGLVNAHELAMPGRSSRKTQTALVKEYYERPSRRRPKGRYVIIANGVLLYGPDALPHPKARFPVIPVYGIQDPESQFGQGLIDHILGHQEQLNRLESQIAEDIADTARPKFQAARECEIDEEAFHRGRGEVIEWQARNGAPAPGAIVTPQIPAQAYEMPERIIDRMQRVAGMNEVTADASAPSGVKSGVALAYLGERDDTRLALANADAADAWRDCDQQMLESIAANWTVPRFVRVLGQGTESEALALMGTDLRGNTEVALESVEGVADSLAAKRQRYQDYVELNIIPLDEPETVIDMLRAMDEQELAEIMTRRAQRVQQMQEQQAAAQQQTVEAQAAQQQDAQDQALQAQAAQSEQEQQAAEQQREHEAQLADQGHQAKLVQALIGMAGRQQAAAGVGAQV